MNAVLAGLKGLGAGRLAALAAVAFAMMGLLTVLALRGPSEKMALLYSDLDLHEAAQISDMLEKQKVPYQVGAGGSQILVTADQVPRARLLLAKEGLPTGGSIGYEIFDRGDALTASQFQQSMNQSRALEGELSRTVRLIQGVKQARVHLVLPKREPFARDRQDAQASVLLTMTGAARLDQEGTRAIVNLIAAAVPGLRPQNIAVTDTRGNLLARAGEAAGPSALAQGNEELRRSSELRISHAIEEMLERSLGPGRVRAEASVDFDYEQLHETKETYDPEGQVVRSTQSVTNNSKTTEQAPAVSVQNNLPNADAGKDGAGTSDNHQEETTNYEIAKVVRTVVRDQPRLSRVSIAVMVDGVTTKGEDGVVVWKERPAEELDRITRLVRSAIGFDEKRGDRVEVVSMRFASDAEQEGDGQAGAMLLGLERSDVMRLAQTAVFGVLGLLAVLFVLRPMLGRVSAVQQLQLAGGGAGGVLGGPEGALALGDGRTETGVGALTTAGGLPALTGPSAQARIASGGSGGSQLTVQGGVPANGQEDESMINIVNIEGQLRASSVRRIADLIDKHPDESLSIMRTWMHQEAA